MSACCAVRYNASRTGCPCRVVSYAKIHLIRAACVKTPKLATTVNLLVITLSFYFVIVVIFYFGVFLLYLWGEGSKEYIKNTANLIQSITLVRPNSVYFGIKNPAKYHEFSPQICQLLPLLAEKEFQQSAVAAYYHCKSTTGNDNGDF